LKRWEIKADRAAGALKTAMTHRSLQLTKKLVHMEQKKLEWEGSP
jgi:hypothetical protein